MSPSYSWGPPLPHPHTRRHPVWKGPSPFISYAATHLVSAAVLTLERQAGPADLDSLGVLHLSGKSQAGHLLVPQEEKGSPQLRSALSSQARWQHPWWLPPALSILGR